VAGWGFGLPWSDLPHLRVHSGAVRNPRAQIASIR
jgi:hypothetical protein